MRRLHLVSLPWTATTEEYLTCAYTQKVVKFCRMYEKDPDTHITLYSSELNEAPCDEHVALFSEAERHDFYGSWKDDNVLFDRVSWDKNDPSWVLWNQRATSALMERARGDLVLLGNGNPFAPTEKAVRGYFEDDVVVCEPFVGYEGTFTEYCAFESHTWRNHVYGLNQWRHGRWYDTTIPNYFDPKDFKVLNNGNGEYLAYLGRVIERKGVREATEIARAAGMPLKVAGPGVKEWGDNFIVGEDITINYEGLEYVGEVGVRDRAEFLAGAKALLVPTLYVEPFGGVAVEAMMCGTPVLSTDWGAFTETVEPGVSGYRFNTLREALDAPIGLLSPQRIRSYARRKYSLKAIRPKYDRWFGQLEGLWGPGWGAL